MEVLYRAHATASGGGRDEGRSATDDGKIDVRLSVPTEMGGKGGDGTNPEQLFATGYAACYLGALRLVAGKAGTPVGPDTKVTAGVGFGRTHAAKASTSTSRSKSPTTAWIRPSSRNLSTRRIRSAPTPTPRAATSMWPCRRNNRSVSSRAC